MPKLIDLMGKGFGRLTVVGGPDRSTVRIKWLCRCECGNTLTAQSSNLISGNTTSCGCWHKEELAQRRFKHGFNNSDPVYRAWSQARDRCNRANHPRARYYGGKGIKVCDRWADFRNFDEDMRPTWFPGATLERRKNNLGYSPSNARWATWAEQAANRSNCRFINVNGEKITAAEFSRRFGVCYDTVLKRHRLGKSFDDIIKRSPFPQRK